MKIRRNALLKLSALSFGAIFTTRIGSVIPLRVTMPCTVTAISAVRRAAADSADS